MKFRQKFLGYSGGLMTMFGVVMMILGKDTADLSNIQSTPPLTPVNGAAGVPMWAGLVIIMSGLANIVEAFEEQRRPGLTYYDLPFSMMVFFANFVALVASAVLVGLLSWSLYPRYLSGGLTVADQEPVVAIYSTIIVIASFVFIFALMAMFIDCCLNGFIGWGMAGVPPVAPVEHPQRERESPYDTYQGRPALGYKM